MSRYGRNYLSENKKWLIISVAFICVFICIGYIILSGVFGSYNPAEWLISEVEEPEDPEEDGPGEDTEEKDYSSEPVGYLLFSAAVTLPETAIYSDFEFSYTDEEGVEHSYNSIEITSTYICYLNYYSDGYISDSVYVDGVWSSSGCRLIYVSTVYSDFVEDEVFLQWVTANLNTYVEDDTTDGSDGSDDDKEHTDPSFGGVAIPGGVV